jgi:predicted Rossmann fold nucleotide-binding protein DprA/Smf involved in DNA uptake
VGLSRRDFALLLAMTPGIGGRTVTRVLARNDLLSRSPEAFLRLAPESMKEEYGVRIRSAELLKEQARDPAASIGPLQERLDKLGVGLVTSADAHYPERVESMDPDPPGVLFLYGNTKLLEGRTYCVLSSRNTTRAGLELMERLAEERVLNGEVAVAGHDTPEYQRSALVPLRWGAPRILCLDRGLFHALGENLTEEPFRAARLWRYQFDPSTDLVVSPFRPESHFIGVNNQVRDRLVACLSLSLDFVEISPGGNMEKLAKLALKAGRSVRVSDRSVSHRSLRELGAEII